MGRIHLRSWTAWFVLAWAVFMSRQLGVVGAEVAPNSELSILWEKPFVPRDHSLFPTKAYGAPQVEPNIFPQDEEKVRAELENILKRMVEQGRLEKKNASECLEMFDDPERRQWFTDPRSGKFFARLLAGVLILAGTSAEEAVPTLLKGRNPVGRPAQVIFTNLAPGAIAKTAVVEGPEGGELWLLTLNGSEEDARMMGEPLPVIAATLAHEAMHQDNEQGQNEEITAKWFERVVWAEFLLLDSKLAEVQTPVTRVMNLECLMWLNSGAEWPWPGLKRAPVEKIQVASGASGLDYGSYEEFLIGELYSGLRERETKGNAYLNALLGESRKDLAFTEGLIQQLDGTRAFQKRELFGLLQILKLTPAE